MRLSIELYVPQEVLPPPPAEVLSAPAPLPGRSVEEAVQRAEEMTGGSVGVEPLDLNLARAAMQEGVLVDLSIHWWRGRVRMSSMDVGIPDDAPSARPATTGKKAKKRRITATHMHLFPTKIIDDITAAETRLRRSPRDSGFRIEGYRGHFVPSRGWEDFKKLFSAGKANMMKAIDNLCDDLETHKKTVAAEIAEFAPRAWIGHRPTWDEMGTAEPGYYARTVEPTTAFVDWFVTKFLVQIPTAEIIRAHVDVHYDLSIPHVPEVSAALEVARGQVSLQAELHDSLEAQRDSLPRRFIDAVLFSCSDHLSAAAAKIATSSGKRTGEATRLANQTRKLAAEVRRMNLTRDPRVEGIAADMEREIRTVEARANGSQRPLDVAEVAAPTIKAAAALAALAAHRGEAE